ncbi:MAG: IPT/TIG domain-containing protein [Deltaproteobacteria bacterium]|nr:IPT/TIG domain-containing protein [Deltaproteobacteria bacterium]
MRSPAGCVAFPLLALFSCLPLEPTRQTPGIDAIEPEEAAAGQEVTLRGHDFGGRQGSSRVSFGAVTAGTALSWSDVEITLAVPEAEPGEVDVVVTVEGLKSAPVSFVIAAAPTPVIASIEPAGAAPGDLVTIAGSAFGSERGPQDTVIFADEVDAAGGISSWTDTAIQVSIPETAVSGNVVVSVAEVPSAPFYYTLAGDAPPDAGPDAAPDAPSGPTLGDVQTEVFTEHCAKQECHDSQTARSGLVLEPGLAYANLVNVASRERPAILRVVPGSAEDSYLFMKIARDLPPDGDRMPQSLPPLPDRLIELVRAWIDAGAAND